MRLYAKFKLVYRIEQQARNESAPSLFSQSNQIFRERKNTRINLVPRKQSVLSVQ